MKMILLKEKIKSAHFWLVLLSMLFYIVSMFFTPFYVADEKVDIYSNSLFVLLSGWMAVLGGGLVPTIIWLANPLYFVALFFILNRVKFGVIAITLALGLAIYFTTLNSIMNGESGATTAITKLGAGFYLWIFSFAALFLAGSNMLIKKKMEN